MQRNWQRSGCSTDRPTGVDALRHPNCIPTSNIEYAPINRFSTQRLICIYSFAHTPLKHPSNYVIDSIKLEIKVSRENDSRLIAPPPPPFLINQHFNMLSAEVHNKLLLILIERMNEWTYPIRRDQ